MGFRWILLATLVAGVMGAVDVQAQVTHNSVTLNWTTPGDDSWQGRPPQFDIRYSTSPITAANFASATPGPRACPRRGARHAPERSRSPDLSPSTTYWFAIKTADEVPNWAGLSNVVSSTTARRARRGAAGGARDHRHRR